MLRLVTVIAGVIACIAVIGWFAMFQMPGTAHEGPLPESDADLEALSDRLEDHVRKLAGQIGPRTVEKIEQYRHTAEYLQQQLVDYGYEPETEPIPLGDETIPNVIVEKRGVVDPEQIVLIGAHYDTARNTPGADDNASAVAALLELARILESKSTPKTVRLVFFANEERPNFEAGQMGSLVHARKAHRQGTDIRAMLSLEMLGYYATEPGSQKYPPGLSYIYPGTGDFIAFVANIQNRSLLADSIETFRRRARFPSYGLAGFSFIKGISLSDHSSFWEYDFPAIMVTDTAFFRNPHYHEPTDTPDKLDFLRLARVVRGLYPVIHHLAGAPP